MFESVTKRRKNPFINAFGWFLLIVVCIVFVFIGFSPNSSFLGSGGAAAEVNGDAISLKEYKEILDRFDSKNTGAGKEARRKTQENAINFLVSRSLIVQEAEKLNIHVTDEEVRSEILGIEPFYEDGVFSKTRYRQYLRQAGYGDPSQFEDRVRRDLLVRKMSTIIGYAAKDLKQADDLDEKIDQAQVNIGYAKLTPQNVGKGSGTADVSKFLSEKEKKVKEYYDNHKSEYATPEQVKARHILVKAKDQKKESMDEALKKMIDIAGKTNADNFAEMAEKHSEDPGSKKKGGSLGFFPRGRMVPEFEKAAFSTEIGKITEPVKTSFGYHIIYVEEKKEASEKSFDDVKTQIARKLTQEESFETALDSLKGFLKDEKAGELESFLQTNNIKWSTTGFFSITKENIPGVGRSKDFLELALSLGPDKEYPKRLVYQGESAYVLKFKGAKMDSAKPQNTQMDFFKQLMKQQKANAMVQTWTDSLRSKATVKINPDLLR